MNKDTIFNIILIVSLILIFHGMMNSGSSDKKTADAAQGETAAGAIGAVGSFVMRKANPAVAAVGLFNPISLLWIVIPTLLLLVPGFFKNVVSIFQPAPTIPIWVWIGGFFLLFMMMMGNRR